MFSLNGPHPCKKVALREFIYVKYIGNVMKRLVEMGRVISLEEKKSSCRVCRGEKNTLYMCSSIDKPKTSRLFSKHFLAK